MSSKDLLKKYNRPNNISGNASYLINRYRPSFPTSSFEMRRLLALLNINCHILSQDEMADDSTFCCNNDLFSCYLTGGPVSFNEFLTLQLLTESDHSNMYPNNPLPISTSGISFILILKS